MATMKLPALFFDLEQEGPNGICHGRDIRSPEVASKTYRQVDYLQSAQGERNVNVNVRKDWKKPGKQTRPRGKRGKR
jgi:hypothetical protein